MKKDPKKKMKELSKKKKVTRTTKKTITQKTICLTTCKKSYLSKKKNPQQVAILITAFNSRVITTVCDVRNKNRSN